MIKTRPIKSKEELMQLIENAEADDHSVIGATHIMTKDDEIVGYFSIGGVMHVHVWCDSKKMTAADSLVALSQAEAVIAQMAPPNGYYIMSCDDNSPFFPKMDKLGYSPLFNTNLFNKEV